MRFIGLHSQMLKTNDFPKTRFYGSKRRLLPWYEEKLSSLSFRTALDRFGGTGSVSLLLQNMGKDVSYYDILNFNSISAEALFSLEECPDADKFSDFIKNIKPLQGMISNTFKNIYYSDSENQWLDGIMEALKTINNKEFKNTVYYCLFQSCLKKRPFNMFHRANYYLRSAKVKRSFGNLTTWNTPFTEHMYQVYLDLVKYKQNRASKINKVKVISDEILESDSLDFDLVYLDPPYIEKSMSDDYFKRYHFLEGLCRYEEWSELINYNKKIKAIETPSHIKQWHNKETFKSKLYNEIEKFKRSTVVLSYQTDGYPAIDSIYDYFVSLFRQVHIYRKPHTHALSKKQKTEVIIIGCPHE